MTFSPFGPKRLSDIDASDLQSLIDNEVVEGLFVEYKSEWTSHKVARAVASFANSPGGGWLIVGIEAAGLLPKAIAPLDDNAELEERVVSTVRSSVTPVPSFAPRAVETEPGKAGLVVHVPEGTQPPYILVRTGQVLVRTATSSEPVGIHDREALDRLFARGERGRIWASEQAEGMRGAEWNSVSARVVTIPAVEHGLAAIPAIFVPSFLQAVIDEMELFQWVGSAILDHDVQPSMSQDVIGVRTLTMEGVASYASMHVWQSGVIRSDWGRPRKGSDVEALKTMLKWALPSHSRLYETRLGHRGDVAVVALARWEAMGGGAQATFVANPPVPLEELNSPSFHDFLGRAIERSVGNYVSEPEP